jgi:hypothetical protein
MIKILQKKVFKIIPVWLLVIILATGIGFGAFAWISNVITGTVTVTVAPITLAGTFSSTIYENIPMYQGFTYTVNSGTPTGFIWVSITSSGTVAAGDFLVSSVWMVYNAPDGASGVLVAGYPKLTTHAAAFVFGNASDSGNAFNFGSTTGTIEFYITCAHTGTYISSIRVTSTSS